MADWSRSFRITMPDGTVLDGAQFPSGRCVLDDHIKGLLQAALSFEELPYVKYAKDTPGAKIEWPDGMVPGLIEALSELEKWRALYGAFKDVQNKD